MAQPTSNKCLVCTHNDANIFNYPCGHVSYCANCAGQAKQINNKCPNCRTIISDYRQIFHGGFKDSQNLQSWKSLLYKWDLSEFTDEFKQNGYTDPIDWKFIQELDLKNMGMQKGHILRFNRNLREYNKFNQVKQKVTEQKEKKPCDVCNGNKQIKEQESCAVNAPCPVCKGNGYISVRKSRPKQIPCSHCDPPGSGKALQHSDCWGNSHPEWDPNTQLPHPVVPHSAGGAEKCSYCIAGSPNCGWCNGRKFKTEPEYYYESTTCNGCSGAKFKTTYKDKWSVCISCDGTGIQI